MTSLIKVIPVLRVIAYATPINGETTYMRLRLSLFKNISAADVNKQSIVPMVRVIFLPKNEYKWERTALVMTLII